MNQIEKQIDSIIAKLKTYDELKPLHFVREYGSHSVEMPITGLVAVVSVTDTALSKEYIGGYLNSSVKGEQFSAKVEMSVYAPATENGSGLSEITSQLVSLLKKADSQQIIVETSASPIAFDPDMNAIYRNVDFVIEFCLCEEA